MLDIDECTDNTHNCDDNAVCTNTIGSFICTCNIGYAGDGHTCNGKKVFWIYLSIFTPMNVSDFRDNIKT